MEPLLAWQNLVFAIPLAAGLILVATSAFGGGHHGGAHDGTSHGDTHHGASGALSALGVGRVPLTLLLMIALLLFGGIGTVSNTLLAPVLDHPWVFGPISVAISLVGTLVLTGRIARLADRWLPSVETYTVSRHDFAGCTGMLLLPSDASSGLAQVKDREGNVHNVRCRAARGVLPKRAEVLVIEYDESTQTYLVDAHPLSSREPRVPSTPGDRKEETS